MTSWTCIGADNPATAIFVVHLLVICVPTVVAAMVIITVWLTDKWF